MLHFTDKTLEEIAVSVGMNGGNYFSRMFKKLRGLVRGNIGSSDRKILLERDL